MRICRACAQPIYANQREIFGYHESCLRKRIEGQFVVYTLPTGGSIRIKLNREQRRLLRRDAI
ncbi:MAG: hypothetical protein ACP5RJ_09190 [Conexivisphaera sp.]